MFFCDDCFDDLLGDWFDVGCVGEVGICYDGCWVGVD